MKIYFPMISFVIDIFLSFLFLWYIRHLPILYVIRKETINLQDFILFAIIVTDVNINYQPLIYQQHSCRYLQYD